MLNTYNLVLNKSIVSIVKREDKLLNINLKRADLVKVFFVLKKSTFFNFEQCLDIVCVDNLLDSGKPFKRFDLYYYLVNIMDNDKILVRLNLNDDEPLESISNVYESAGWLEREILDMYGLHFHNHKDLRRILTDYGFKGNPMRKDYPLTGYNESRYDEEFKLVLLEPLSVNQDYRFFNFHKAW